MRMLILGYSGIVQRRVLPALMAIDDFVSIDVASRSKAVDIDLPVSKKGDTYADYLHALESSKADIVYISTMNSDHAKWAEEALEKNFHVIVDKPAFLSLDTAEKLVALSKSKNKLLAEATVYEYHPQIEKIRSIFYQHKILPIRINAMFSFPALSADNFRYRKELGGGALLDLGVYAVSLGRIFFDAEPDDIYCKVNSWYEKEGVDTSFSALIVYSNGRSMVGHFGFNTQYQNKVNVLGDGLSIDVDRVFTNSPDAESLLRVSSGMNSSDQTVSSSDCFVGFFTKILQSVKLESFHSFTENLLSDARAMSLLNVSAQNNSRD